MYYYDYIHLDYMMSAAVWLGKYIYITSCMQHYDYIHTSTLHDVCSTMNTYMHPHYMIYVAV